MRQSLLGVLAVSATLLAPLDAWCDSHQRGERDRAADFMQDDLGWSAVEERVWEDISSRRKVNLSGPCPDWKAAEVQPTGDIHTSAYTIRGLFLRQILTEDRFRPTTSERPITVTGARIVGDVVIEGGQSQESVTIACSTIEGQIRIVAREMDRPLRLISVQSTGSLVLTDIHARSDVLIERSDFPTVWVIQSRIDGTLSLRGSQVRDSLIVASTIVGHGPILGCRYDPAGTPPDDCRTRYGKTDFRSVETRGLMTLDRSLFVEELGLQEVSVGGSILARNVVLAKGFELLGGTIEGRLQMDGSRASGEIYLEALTLGDSVHIRGSIFPDLSIVGVHVGRDVDFRKSKLRRVNLSGTVVHGALRLADPGQEVDWSSLAEAQSVLSDNVREDIVGGGAHFIARNTRVGVLQDTKEAWPAWLRRELDGFEYDKLGGLWNSSDTAPYLRGAKWFKEWLGADESYSPQPYRHLSAVLRREGQRAVATEILYEAYERERRALPLWDGNRIWLEILRYAVGYGVGLKTLRALSWMGMLALIGWVVGVHATRRRSVSSWTLLWHSVSHTVPGFAIAKRDYVPMSLRARSWFYMQRLICYALALIAAAAATGIIQ